MSDHTPVLTLDRGAERLWDVAGRLFVPHARRWQPSTQTPAGETVDTKEAVAWLQRESGAPCRTPIGVIGPRAARPEQLAAAEQLGEMLAEQGLTVLCGGRQGVMEAVCRGVARGGGISVGLLPDPEAQAANPYVTIPIATGIGVARNAIVARAALCLIAIGGGHGTASEVAFGLQFARPVFGLLGPPPLPGVQHCVDVMDAVSRVERVVLGLSV